jgi:hypothetical protein
MKIGHGEPILNTTSSANEALFVSSFASRFAGGEVKEKENVLCVLSLISQN